jgi:uncharacterized membrane protein
MRVPAGREIQRKKDAVDIAFRFGISLKAIYAVGELLTGIAMSFLDTVRMGRLVHWVTRRELAVDPDDRLMNYLLTLGHSYTLDMQKFVMVYLLLHGLLKTTVLVLLVKKVRWGYPLAAAVFSFFVVYQILSFLRGHSPFMIYQSVLDVALVVLILVEYQRLEPKEHRHAAADRKIQRLRAALQHREGDRIPVSDFFWTGFVERAKAHWGPGFDPYRHFDLDYVVLHPNMDPHIQPFEILFEQGEEVVLRTGFEAVIRRSGTIPMPHFESFSVTEPEQMAAFRFDSPSDPRRFHAAGDDQLNGVGDALSRNTPAWSGRVDAYADDFAVFGSICEPYEYLWRIIGSENALVWQVLEPEAYNAFVDRIGAFLLELARAQIREGAGRLSGFYIWGDVAYRNGMLFNPETWRKVFLPHVKRLVDLFRENGLMVIYHGCGNATPIFEDLADIGLDAYNPLEAKADLDVVELRKRYGDRLAFVGNIDVRILETGDREAIRREVLYKMQAGQGGGWVCQSDHSVSSGVSPESYALVVETVREFGRYPLDLDRIRAELE